MTWELKTAADLKRNRTYVVKGDYHASARKVTGEVVAEGEAVTFPARAVWGYREDETTVTLDASANVYILKCTCKGMAFIANRWTYTGQCGCLHHALPKES